MPNIRFMKTVFAVAFLFAGLGAEAGPFTNGSFETINRAAIPPAEGALLYPGDTWLTGWTVGGPGGGDLEVANTSGDGINAYDGQQLIVFNMSDTPPGGILSQTLTTTVGQSYAVSFAVAKGGYAGGSVSLTSTALAMNGALLASNYCAPTSGVWVLCQMPFIAVSTTTTLVFTDTSADTVAEDLLLDDVTVTTNQPGSGPTIVTSPVSQSVAAGSQATFTASASGNPATVQWYFIGYQGTKAITGATSTTLNVTASGATAGGYFAVFTNSAGSATTSTANLAVTGLVFTNGSFENPVVSGGVGVSSMPGWMVVGSRGSVALNQGTAGGLSAYDGQQFVSFGGVNEPSGDGVAQTFSTVVGMPYVVTYHVGESGSGANLSITGTAFDAVGNLLASNRCAPASGAWTQCQMSFTATTADTTLVFQDSSVVDVYGASVALDAITVVANSTAAPVVTTSPVSQSVVAGTQATFTASASGSPSTVQWYFVSYQGTKAMAGATNTALNVTASGPTAGGYFAVFSNSAGSATSGLATLAVLGLPFVNGSFETINHAPIPSGGWAFLYPGDTWLTGWTVGGPGGGDLGVDNGTGGGLNPYDGQQFISFNGADTPPGGSLSQTFTTTVGQGYTVTFAVGKIGTGNVSLTATVVASNNAVIASNYCIPTSGVWTLFQLAFTAVTTNTTLVFLDSSAQTIAVDIDLDDVTVTANQPPGAPSIVTSPVSQSVAAGTQATFTASASGSPSSVQWYFVSYQGTKAMAGATSTTLNVTASGATAGGYFAVFTNSAGSATTSTANLAVAGLVFTNGSFENPVIPAGTAGESSLPGWKVVGSRGSVGLSHGATGGLSAYDGQQFVFFGGVNEPSGDGVAQTVSTVVGMPYVVTYYVGESGPGTNLSLTGTAFDAAGNLLASNRCAPASGAWTQRQMSFTAATADTTLVFQDTSVVDIYGAAIALDDVTVTVNAGPPCTPPVSSLVSWWRGEENALDTWDGNNGTLAGATTYGPGMVGQGFVLAHAGDAVKVGSATNLQLQDFTIEGWMERGNPSLVSLDPQGDGEFFSFGIGGYAFGLHSSGQLFLSRVGYDLLNAMVSVTDANFHHVAITKSGTTVVFYLDGVGHTAGSYGSTFSFTTAAAIGARGDTQGNSFYGTIDEMSVYNGVLSAAQIQAIYNAGATGKCVPQGPPVVFVQPAAQSVLAGSAASFTAQASGSPSTVQWYLINYQGSNAIAGATNTTLNVTASGPTAGGYFAVFSNTAGSATTSTANFAVTGLVFTNGSFEIPAISGSAGETAMPGWTVGGIRTPVGLYHGSTGGLGPVDGQQWVIFGGVNEPSGDALCQTFTTVVGTPYGVTYYVGESGSGGNLSFTGTAFDALGNLLASNRCAPASGIWIQCQMSFTAATTNTTLVFTDTSVVDVYGASVGLDAITAAANAMSAPVVTLSPVSQTANSGATVSFSASASGSPSTLQWYFGTNKVAGASGTNSPLTFTASDATAGKYTAVFSNSYGTATSAVAVLTVIDPPVITTSPVSQVVVAGTPVTFTASASGSASTVQWYFGTSAISGATSTNLTFTAFAASAGNYSAKFINAAGTATSAVAMLTVNAGPFTNGSFEVINHAAIPSGGEGLLYPGDTWLAGWTVGGPGGGDVAVDNGPGGDQIPPYDGQQFIMFNAGNTAPGATLSQTFTTTVGQYYAVSFAVDKAGSGNVSLTATVVGSSNAVIASNYCVPTSGVWTVFHLGFTAVSTNTTLVFLDSSTQTVAVDLALDAVSVVSPPVIVTSPVSRTNLIGTTATFTASASGNPAGVQWFQGSNPVPNATNATLSFTVNAGSGGSYTAVFSNAAGSATTAVAVLTVNIPIFLTQQPQSVTTNVGATVTFAGAAGGTAPLSFQWQFNGTNIKGATGTNLVLTNAQAANAGSYALVASNPYGTNTSTNAVLAFISTLQVVSASVAGSSTFTIPVNLIATGDESAIRFSLNFDPAVLTFKGIKAGSGAAGASFTPNTNNASSGQIGVLAGYFGSSFSPGTKDLVDVTFAAAFAAKPVLTTISFGDAPAGREIIDTNFNLIAGAYLGGTLTVTPSSLEGDVWPRTNGDYSVDARDWVQEGRFVAGLDTVSNTSEFQRADCAPRATGGDGVIDALDLAQAGRYAVGLDPGTPAGWTAGVSPAPGVFKAQTPHPLDGTVTRTISLVPMTGAANTVMVQLFAEGDENTVDFSVTFDPTILSFVSATEGAGISMFIVNSNGVAAGNLGIVLAQPGGQAFAAGANQIATLVFRAVSYSNQATLAFGDTPVQRSVADVTASYHLATAYQSGSLAVGGAAWPQLAISQSAGGLTLSWPSSPTILTAQWSSDLGANWTKTGGTPVTNGGTVFLTLPSPTNTTFYRLAQP